jgi:phage protein Gp37/Gp68
LAQIAGVEGAITLTIRGSAATKGSPACDHCAEAQEDARYGQVEWGGPRLRIRKTTRRAPYRWDHEAAAAGERRRVFCMSLGDFWDNQVSDAWHSEALEIIRQCRDLEWLILTKRPQNIVKMLPTDWGEQGWPWNNECETRPDQGSGTRGPQPRRRLPREPFQRDRMMMVGCDRPP